MAKRDETKDEAAATASASEARPRRRAKDMVKEIEHAAHEVAEKVTHGAGNFAQRVDTALHYGRDEAKEAASVDGDGGVYSKDVAKQGGACATKCAIQ